MGIQEVMHQILSLNYTDHHSTLCLYHWKTGKKKNAFYNLQELNLKNHYGKEYQSFHLTDFFTCYEIEKTGPALIKSKLF